MTWEELILVLFVVWLFMPKGERRQSSRCRRFKFEGPPGPRPVTPEPTYICCNCGMLIHTGHGHTEEECEEYENDPTKPDLRLQRIITEKNRPRRGDPKIRKPYYREPGTFKNWGAGI